MGWLRLVVKALRPLELLLAVVVFAASWLGLGPKLALAPVVVFVLGWLARSVLELSDRTT